MAAATSASMGQLALGFGVTVVGAVIVRADEADRTASWIWACLGATVGNVVGVARGLKAAVFKFG